MKKSTLVIGVIGADCHAVGNKVLDRVFTAHDFRVINLGVMVSQDEYIDAAIETGADAIVVSSIYGHGDTTASDYASAALNAASATSSCMSAVICSSAKHRHKKGHRKGGQPCRKRTFICSRRNR